MHLRHLCFAGGTDYKSVTRENQILNNVFHDGPRSGVNYNDGAMGGGESLSTRILG